MRKIYFIYVTIPEKVFNTKVKYLISNSHNYRWKNGNMYGLYAWSTKKKLIKEFLEIRNNSIYTVINKEIDEDYYKEVKSTYGTSELKLLEYKHLDSNKNLNTIEVVSTKDELRCSTIDHQEYLEEFGPSVYSDLPITLFNDKLYVALDTIGYVSDYYSLYGTDEEADYYAYNKSFGLTCTGKSTKIFSDADTVNILLYLFHYLFYGKESGGN